MKFSDPDDAIRAYTQAKENSTVASRSVVGHGREYQDRCEKTRCRRLRSADRAAERRDPDRLVRPPWVERHSKEEATTIQACTYCGSPRRWASAYVYGGHVGAGRRGSPPSAMVKLGDLAPIGRMISDMRGPEQLKEEGAAAYVIYCWSHRSRDHVAHALTLGRWPEGLPLVPPLRFDVIGRRTFTENDVRRFLRQGRGWMERRLRAAGLYVPKAALNRFGGNQWLSDIST